VAFCQITVTLFLLFYFIITLLSLVPRIRLQIVWKNTFNDECTVVYNNRWRIFNYPDRDDGD